MNDFKNEMMTTSQFIDDIMDFSPLNNMHLSRLV